MENTFNQGHDMIDLDNQEKFVNAVSEIFEGDFHPANPKLNLVGDYSKCVGCGDLDSVILYDIAHEKEHQRICLFGHMVNPFWATYQPDHTHLNKFEKFLIFQKVLKEVIHVYPVETLEEILYAVEAQLKLEVSDVLRLRNGKMWHDYYMKGYVKFAMSKLSKDSKGFYY